MTPWGVKQGPSVCDTPILVISIAQWGLINDYYKVNAESTKQMEQTLRAKFKIFFESENLKKCS